MLTSIRKKTSSVINSVTESYLDQYIEVGNKPKFVKHDLYVIKCDNGEEAKETLMKQLLKLICFDGTDNYSCLSIFCSLSILINPAIKKALFMELEDCGVAVREVTMAYFLFFYEELREVDVEDL